MPKRRYSSDDPPIPSRPRETPQARLRRMARNAHSQALRRSQRSDRERRAERRADALRHSQLHHQRQAHRLTQHEAVPHAQRLTQHEAVPHAQRLNQHEAVPGCPSVPPISMGSTGCLPSDNVTIQWKGHADIVVKGLEQLFREQYLVDADVSMRGESLKAHKMVLALFLPAFRKLVDGTNGQLYQLNLDYVANGTEDVKALIEFAYTGTVSVSKDRLGHLGRLAECLQFEGLSNAIAQLRDGDLSANRQASPDVCIKEEHKDVEPNAELSADQGYDVCNEQCNHPGDDSPDVIEDFVATLDVPIKEEPKGDDVVMESSVDQDFRVSNKQYNHPGDNPPDLLATDAIEHFVTSPGVPIKEEPKDDDAVRDSSENQRCHVTNEQCNDPCDYLTANDCHSCNICGIIFNSADSHMGHHLKYHKANKSYKCTACATELPVRKLPVRKFRLGSMLAGSSGPSTSGCDNQDKVSPTNMVGAEASTKIIVTTSSAGYFSKFLRRRFQRDPPAPSERAHDKDAEDLKDPTNVPAKFSTCRSKRRGRK